MKLRFITFCLFLICKSFAQTNTPPNNSEKIKNYIETYFLQDRENIYVQFNKNTYVTNEDIGFTGYVLSKNSKALSIQTSNIQLVIYNEQDEIVQKQLLYASNGTFSGVIQLNNKFKSGTYHFHFYTNWMNNFNEDDSFTQAVEIINKDDTYNMKSNEPNWKTASATLFPESGAIIAEINNTVGVKITDCNQKGIEVQDALILDSKSKEISRFNTNKLGNGIFYFIPDITETYTLKITTDKLNISQRLPITKETGIVISYNNQLPKNIFAVALKTNEKGLELYKDKKYILLIHQNAQSIQKEFTFDNNETEKVLVFDKKYLSNGVNTIRLLDENLNEVTERLVYHYGSEKTSVSIEAKSIDNDRISLTGKTTIKNASLSISVLPENTVGNKNQNSILGTIYLNAYLEKPEINNYSYFDSNNPNRKKDMEALMLNQTRSKALWSNIKNKPPEFKFPFTKGVTISGRIDEIASANSKNKISLISLKNNVFEEAPLLPNGDFKFENFFAQDSTVFLLQMVNDKNIVKNMKMDVHVRPTESHFMLPKQFQKNICPIEQKPENEFTFTKPLLGQDMVNLTGVTVTNAFKKDVLIHEEQVGLMATGYKIGESDYGSVLDFIGRHGFRAGLDPEDNSVYIRSTRDAMSNDPPAVFIDNILSFDLNMLFNMQLSEVDEIYIDKTGSSNITSNSGSSIQIFLKQGGNMNSYYKTKYTSLIVTTGFAQPIEFKNASFDTQKEFFYFGTLNWTPAIAIKDNPNFELKFPKGAQKEIQVLVEGITTDGQLISEIQTIPVQ